MKFFVHDCIKPLIHPLYRHSPCIFDVQTRHFVERNELNTANKEASIIDNADLVTTGWYSYLFICKLQYWVIPRECHPEKQPKWDGFWQVMVPTVHSTTRRHRSKAHRSPRWPPGCDWVGVGQYFTKLWSSKNYLNRILLVDYPYPNPFKVNI